MLSSNQSAPLTAQPLPSQLQELLTTSAFKHEMPALEREHRTLIKEKVRGGQDQEG